MTRFLFLDLETTGLRPGKDQVLEIYAFPVDIQHRGPNSLPECGAPGPAFHHIFKYRREDLLALCSDEVLKMHLESGLLSEDGSYADEDGSTQRHAQEWREFWLYCQKVSPPLGDLHLAGLSVHFDLSFLSVAPRAGYNRSFPFSHRILDITSLKLLWPSAFIRHSSEAKRHRAKDDAIEAYETLIKGLSHLMVGASEKNDGPVARP